MRSSSADTSRWTQLDRLLEEALTLAPEERDGWLDRLSAESGDLSATLRRLLAHATQVETGDFLERLPELPAHIADDPSQLSEGLIFGGYRLLQELGRGGMGEVWLAERTDGLIDRKVALKLPIVLGSGRGLAARFAREREILASLDHPRIARLHDAGVSSDGRPFIAIEWVEGESLGNYCARHHPDLKTRLNLFQQITDAVAYAHRRLVIHRDLKPSNIMVNPEGHVRLLDFGVAKLLSDEVSLPDGQVTQSVGQVLTPHYAAPEHIRGDPTTVACDVYSLGVVLYELLTEQKPYLLSPGSIAEWDRALREKRIARPSEVAPRAFAASLRGDLDSIIAEAMRYDPSERYGSVESLADDLSRYRRGHPVRARAGKVVYRVRKFVARHGLSVAVATAVAATVTITAAVALWQRNEAQVQRDRAVVQQQQLAATNQFYARLLEDAGAEGQALASAELLDRGRQMLELQHVDGEPFIGRLYYELSRRYAGLREVRREAELLTRAAEIARAQNDDDLLARTLCAMSRSNPLAQADAARRHVSEAKDVIAAATFVTDATIADCLRAEAMLHQRAGALDEATDLLERARQRLLQSSVRSPRQLNVLLNDLSLLDFNQGRLQQSLGRLDEILAVNESMGLDRTMGQLTVMGNKGAVLGRAGEVLAHLAVLDEIHANAGRSRLRDRLPNGLLLSRASVLARLARYPEAMAAAQAVQSEARSEGDVVVVAMADNVIGQVQTQMGDYRQAAAAFDRAETALSANPGRFGSQITGLSISRAVLARREQDLEGSRSLINAVLRQLDYPRRKDSPLLRNALAVAAATELAMGNAEAALTLADDGLAFARSQARAADSSADVGSMLMLRARARHALDRIELAGRDAREALPSLLNGLGADHPEMQRAKAFLDGLDGA